MKHILLFIFALLISALTFGQKKITGKVVDASNNKPVGFTNIGIEGTLHGTASDANGNFTLEIPESMADEKMYFSAVGYKNRLFPVKNLFGQESCVVRLQPQSYDIDDVDVEAQNMVILRILRTASENIRYNYGAGPFNLHCKYTKNTTKNNGINITTNANVLIFDKTGYSQPSHTEAFASRKYRITKTDDNYTFSSNMLKIDELLSLDWVRLNSNIINPALFSDYQVKIEDQPEINGKEYWVISFKQKNPTLEGSGDFYASAFEGKITIRKDNYMIYSITGNVKAPKNNRQDRSLAIAENNSNFLNDVSYDFSVDYRNLLINKIAINKIYIYKGDKYNENTILEVNRSHANNLIIVNKRDYFPEK